MARRWKMAFNEGCMVTSMLQHTDVANATWNENRQICGARYDSSDQRSDIRNQDQEPEISAQETGDCNTKMYKATSATGGVCHPDRRAAVSAARSAGIAATPASWIPDL
jgi:hypothetical protein